MENRKFGERRERRDSEWEVKRKKASGSGRPGTSAGRGQEACWEVSGSLGTPGTKHWA